MHLKSASDWRSKGSQIIGRFSPDKQSLRFCGPILGSAESMSEFLHDSIVAATSRATSESFSKYHSMPAKISNGGCIQSDLHSRKLAPNLPREYCAEKVFDEFISVKNCVSYRFLVISDYFSLTPDLVGR